MPSLTGRIVLVAGATGNMGPLVVRALLEQQATVLVTSRSEARLAGLRDQLGARLDPSALDGLHTFVGDLGDQAGADRLRAQVTEQLGPPEAVLAALGEFVSTPSLLQADRGELRRALDSYVGAHFVAARTFLPAVRKAGGTYVLLQGPLAFELHPEFGAHLISIATAAQHMLFRALAQELDDSPARVVELVSHALVRDRQTQPGSPLSGEAVAAYATHLLSGAGEDVHGQSIQLRSAQQLTDAGLDLSGR